MEDSSGHQACMCAVECAIEIAQCCTIPNLKWDEFVGLAQVIWDQVEENRFNYDHQRIIDKSPEAKDEMVIRKEKEEDYCTRNGLSNSEAFWEGS